MNVAILLSGGIGSRLGASIPKQYIKVNDKMILTYALETLIGHPRIDGVLIVADKMWREEILTEMSNVKIDLKKFMGFALSGETRQFSILNALLELENKKDLSIRNVLIHDAARPNLSAKMITTCLKTLEMHEGVMPVLPMKDTIYESVDGCAVTNLLDRSRLFAGQAPEAFRFDLYYDANKNLLPDRLYRVNGSTEPAILAGMDIVMIAGDEDNYKITTPADLKKFERQIFRYE